MPKLPLPLFLDSLSVSGATDHTWEAVIDAGYDSLDSIRSLTAPVLAEIKRDSGVRIGTVNAAKILASFNSDRVQALVSRSSAWLAAPRADAGSPLTDGIRVILDVTGAHVCLTGTGPAERKVLEATLKAAGAIIQSSVNAKTTFLVASEINKGKAQKAAALGTTVRPYAEVFAA